MRINALISLTLLSCFLLTGCQTSLRYPLVQSDNYILVNFKKSGRCYTRIIDGAPFDQICQKRDFLRYTDTPDVNKFVAQVPDHVMALFRAQDSDHLRRTFYRGI